MLKETTNSQSSGSGPLILGNKKPIISNSAVPVEVFVLFLIHNRRQYTICDLIDQFEEIHKIKLKFARMQQIVVDLVNARKVKTYRAINKKNNLVSYYTFEKIS